MSNLVFAWPYAVIALLLLIPMWLFDNKKRRDQGLLFSPVTGAMKALVKDERSSWPRRLNWFMVFGWLLLTISLMRPQLIGEPIEISRDGRNVMLVLDISESMEITDMELALAHVDRLTIAKDVMASFIDKRHGDRLGLLVFGSEAFLHAPLSFDHPMIKLFLDDVQIGFAGPKTAIGDALGLAVKKLIEQTEGDRMIVLLTDGQNNMGSLTPLDAAKIAQKHGVKIYIAGLGASRMVVDGFFGPQAVNPSLSLDEAEPELKSIAAMTHGKYFRAKDHKALQAIYADIDRLEPIKADPIVLVPRKEVFFWPLSLVALMFALRILLLLWRGHAT
jgi:Ca-activated chloride channel homolog